jgi:hypothetical protein
MKVIDLLNKIANGEEVPEIIEFDDAKYYFRKIYKEYYRFDNSSTLYRDYNVFKILNDEVEVLEEDKEIEKIDRVNGSYLVDLRSDSSIAEQSEAITSLVMYLNNNVDKINELIKAVNELKKGK